MVPMRVADIAAAVGGELKHDTGAALIATSAVSDSRQVTDGSVFVAIKGERVDGHDYVASVAERGAVVAIVDHEIEDADIAQVVVSDTVEALGELAKANIERRRATGEPFDIVALTGSVGKTTTKDLLASLLGCLGETVAPVGSFNNEIGLPLTALKVGESTRFFVAEMGASHVGEIASLTRIAPPDLAVVLKVGVAHLGEFGSRERIAQAKSEIIQGLRAGGVSILNADDEHVAAMASLAPSDVVWFGQDDAATKDGAVYASDITVDSSNRAQFTLHAEDGTTAAVTLGIAGRHNVMNALAAAAVAMRMGMDVTAVAQALGEQKTISPHRMAMSVVNRNGVSFHLIDDSFNANPDSMKAGLDALKAWNADDHDQPYRLALLGAMLELGGDEAALHASVGQYAATLGLDGIIAVGSATDEHLDALAQALADGAQGASAVSVAHGIDEAEALVLKAASAHDDTVVLLKGSHASGLSALAERWAADSPSNGTNAATIDSSKGM